MPVSTKVWQQKTLAFFEGYPKRVFIRRELASVLEQEREHLGMPASLSLGRFIDFLEAHGRLVEVKIPSVSEHTEDDGPTDSAVDPPPGPYQPFSRYIWGEASPFEVALSLRRGSYLSHASAVFMHGLTQQIVRTVYANKEQSPKPTADGTLIQSRIDVAFQRPPRRSNYVFIYRGTRLILVNGKNTGNLEVSEVAGPAGQPYPTTKLERTLIDITVRPEYAGGVFEVLEAFRGARERASVPTMIATLKRLQYVYPYHQALGFYLQRAGFSNAAVERLRALGLHYDFYLTYKMPAPQYDPTWRIYYPM